MRFLGTKTLLLLLLSGLLLQAGISNGKTIRQIADEADTLYAQKKFDRAAALYSKIFTEAKQFSPRILLRLATYHQGKGQPAMALYYLNTYYQYIPNPKIRDRIRDLAESQNATGYTFNELDFLIYNFRRYYTEIILSGLFILILVLASIIWNRYKGLPLVYRPLVFFVSLVLGYLFTNLNLIYRQGVITGNEVAIKSGPSAASQVLDFASAGHRILILDRQDVWLHTNWQGKDAYIHSRNVALLEN